MEAITDYLAANYSLTTSEKFIDGIQQDSVTLLNSLALADRATNSSLVYVACIMSNI
jgi:hypothetical protein